jgi:hypothetical protein
MLNTILDWRLLRETMASAFSITSDDGAPVQDAKFWEIAIPGVIDELTCIAADHDLAVLHNSEELNSDFIECSPREETPYVATGRREIDGQHKEKTIVTDQDYASTLTDTINALERMYFANSPRMRPIDRDAIEFTLCKARSMMDKINAGK